MRAFKTGMAAAVVMLAATACGPTGNQECPAVACTLACENGFQQGEDGCDICACNPGGGNNGSTSGGSSGLSSSGSSGMTSSSSGGPICPEYACLALIDCAGPPATDENGCPVCGCQPLECANIRDEAACRAAPECVPVYFSEDGRIVGENATFPAARMECCKETSEGVECAGQPNECWGAWVDQAGNCRGPADGVLPNECCGIHVEVCYDDGECAPGLRCDLENFCESACPPGAEACPAVCLGRCVPDPVQVCWSDSDCDLGEMCDTENFCETNCDDEPGYICDAVCGGRCVPRQDPVRACWSNEECLPGEQCDLVNYCESACGPEAENCIAVCLGRCVPAQDPCAEVRCGGGDVCQVCGPNEDCTTKCVPDSSACAAILCGPDSQCVACGPNEDCVAKCVPVEGVDCRVNGCDAGQECVEVTACAGGGAACTCPAGDPACECPPNEDPACFSHWYCQGGTTVDRCNALTEEQCMPDHDECHARYETACPDCAPGSDCGGECITRYAGCFSSF